MNRFLFLNGYKAAIIRCERCGEFNKCACVNYGNYGWLPIRQELDVLPADPAPENLRLGFVGYELPALIGR